MKRRRVAPWIAGAVGVVLLFVIVIAAMSDPAESRIATSPLLGRDAPAASGDVVSGPSQSLADLRGKYVIVNFFATWCVPCQQEHDDLRRFAAAHPDDARVVSIVFSDDFAEAQTFFEQRGGDWPLIDDEHGAIATAWGVARVPESYLVAPNGRVVGKVTGGVTFDFLQKQIARYS